MLTDIGYQLVLLDDRRMLLSVIGRYNGMITCQNVNALVSFM